MPHKPQVFQRGGGETEGDYASGWGVCKKKELGHQPQQKCRDLETENLTVGQRPEGPNRVAGRKKKRRNRTGYRRGQKGKERGRKGT